MYLLSSGELRLIAKILLQLDDLKEIGLSAKQVSFFLFQYIIYIICVCVCSVVALGKACFMLFSVQILAWNLTPAAP